MSFPLNNNPDSKLDGHHNKIMILGLSNSGKTSICYSLQGNRNLLSYSEFKPTKGLKIVSFKALDSNFSIWDFGGQVQYRKDHLERFHKHVVGAKKIIYVIDVQDMIEDPENYEISLEYLKKIMNQLKFDYVHVDISVFLHKFDPGLIFERVIKTGELVMSIKGQENGFGLKSTRSEDKEDITEEFVGDLIRRIRDIIPEEYNFHVFKTTIYTTFEKTMMV